MTWHAGAEDGAIHGIVDPMERTHLDDPRPRTRPRASTYMPSSASLALPSVESLLNQTESTPRTLPPISGLSPRFAERRAGVRFEHSRSRSASHIQHNVDSFNLPPSRSPYAETVAEQRGQKRPALSVAPPGSSTNVDGMFKTQFQHMRSDSSDALGLPRPMEPSFGATGPEFAPEKSKDAGFVFGNRQLTTTVPLRPRARSSVGASGVSGDRMSKFVFPPPVKENHKMEILEPDVFERRPRRRNHDLIESENSLNRFTHKGSQTPLRFLFFIFYLFFIFDPVLILHLVSLLVILLWFGWLCVLLLLSDDEFPLSFLLSLYLGFSG
ncbi:hypothetical protein BDZ91DRAFT_384053 [Kalaharituber pfeilii]|nr:hypothetical protein BDZ91DRAFT_384053 [Kalaharituber pfeilii]